MMKQRQRTMAFVVGAIALGCCPDPVGSGPTTGVLVLAHGGRPQWNEAVRAAVAQAGLPQPARIAFGMGMSPQDVEAIQTAVEALEISGVEEIVAVPLLISPDSEVMRQFEYLLGLRAEPGFSMAVTAQAGHAIGPVAHRIPIIMTDPLGDHELVAQILLERTQRLSTTPSAETVVLVAHGPTTDADNERWLATLHRLGRWLQQQGHFGRVDVVTLRDDAPPPVQAAATATLRQLVGSANQQGPVLVVPVLVAPGGIEQKVVERLEGLTYRFSGETLLPHPNISRWIAEQVRRRTGTIAENLL